LQPSIHLCRTTATSFSLHTAKDSVHSNEPPIYVWQALSIGQDLLLYQYSVPAKDCLGSERGAGRINFSESAIPCCFRMAGGQVEAGGCSAARPPCAALKHLVQVNGGAHGSWIHVHFFLKRLQEHCYAWMNSCSWMGARSSAPCWVWNGKLELCLSAAWLTECIQLVATVAS
jgi:hypothetical protein